MNWGLFTFKTTDWEGGLGLVTNRRGDGDGDDSEVVGIIVENGLKDVI